MESISNRIQSIIDELFKGNKAAFANAIGVKPTTVSNYIGRDGRNSKPSSDVLESIVNLVHINAIWLLTGKGEMVDECINTETGPTQKGPPGQPSVNDPNLTLDALIKIVESNNILASANKTIAESNKTLAETNAKLTAQIESVSGMQTKAPEPTAEGLEKVG